MAKVVQGLGFTVDAACGAQDVDSVFSRTLDQLLLLRIQVSLQTLTFLV